MKRTNWRWFWPWAALSLLPLGLFAYIAERSSWRPKSLSVASGAPAFQVRFAPDGHTLAIVYGQQSSNVSGRQSSNVSGQHSSNSNFSDGSGGKLELWDFPDLKLRQRIHSHNGNLAGIAFNRRGNYFVTAHQDALTPLDKHGQQHNQHLIRLWNKKTGKLVRTITAYVYLYYGHQVSRLDFWPDENQVIFETNTRIIKVPLASKNADKQSSEGLWWKWWGSADWEHNQIWYPSIARDQKDQYSRISPSVFSPDGSTYAGIKEDGQHYIAFLGNSQMGKKWHWLPAVVKGWSTAPWVFSKDGTLLAGTSFNSSTGPPPAVAVQIWDARSGRLLRSWPLPLKHQANDFVFAPDQKTLAIVEWGGAVTLWDVITGQLKRTLKHSAKPVLSAAFSPDGRMLVSGSEDGSVKLWRIR